ncbi:OmpA/MotB family protein [Mesobacillus selenatarsenatis]|uniref:OmpA family protein n=1 Tax=Mesobacillus selenatarsenatis TaxID=388741 RepID=A0A846TRQ1_9BACI|nr:OmpA family protein [Mesobacillus selenatarsenatis]NKE07957.1 OmpA family protein [Mesobacillus selenatarsenatis]
MNNKYRRLLDGTNSDNDFWPTFTDLLATILLVVILIMVTTTIHNENVTKAMQDEIAKGKTELEDRVKKIEEQEEQIAMLTGIRKDIVSKFEEEFKKTNLDIEIDKETAAIKFNADLLFETGKAEVRPEFKEQLKTFIPIYFNVLYKENEEHIAEIIVEGHTDDVGFYMDNLDLSQKRAYNVVRYILSDEFGDFPFKAEVVKDITANGRSESQLKQKDGNVDRQKSRRVEFKFRLRNFATDESI